MSGFGGFSDTYEDELYREGSSVSSSDEIDSDTEERIMSYLYYQPEAKSTQDTETSSTQHTETNSAQHTEASNTQNTEASNTQHTTPNRGIITIDSDSDSTAETLPAIKSGLSTPMDSLAINAIPHKQIKLTQDPSHQEPADFSYLEEADFQGKNRYFIDTPEIICRKCRQPGHIAKDCQTLTCTICNATGHTARSCSHSGTVCHRCNLRGHIAADCPTRNRVARACERCDSRAHHTEECPSIWRKYVYARAPGSRCSVVAACYNCAGAHFGDECGMPRPRGASAFHDHTAFTERNCTGAIVRAPARGHERSDGARNREERRRRAGYGSAQSSRSSTPRKGDYRRRERSSHRDRRMPSRTHAKRGRSR